uniref:Ku70/Ku80 C-terminal arm domain-containing protein n=1 Tax=Tanacetum cinerariifolium TaxID=118510 RepID=A0A6L2J5F8_TANCI|nr:hypothetical protein [Tanacetum cinerariifolium]
MDFCKKERLVLLADKYTDVGLYAQMVDLTNIRYVADIWYFILPIASSFHSGTETTSIIYRILELMVVVDILINMGEGAMQSHYEIVKGLALDEDEMPEIVDETVPDEEGMSMYSHNDGKLKDLTVMQLKTCLTANKLPIGGKKEVCLNTMRSRTRKKYIFLMLLPILSTFNVVDTRNISSTQDDAEANEMIICLEDRLKAEGILSSDKALM